MAKTNITSMPDEHTGDLFSEPKEPKSRNSEVGRKGLLPVRHANRDFFLADLFDCAFKDDAASMEAPFFSLSTRPDTTVFKWESKDGKRKLEVTPSVLGRATQHDKDILIYLTSQMTEALNRNREDAHHRKVKFTVYNYLVTTNRSLGGEHYDRLEGALKRLKGTQINTDIETGGVRNKRGFGLIDEWEIIEKSPTDERMIAVSVTISEWLYNAIQMREVLTINPDYFRLRKPLERRLYELARKHCGQQPTWLIGLTLLYEKSGSRATIKEFRRMLLEIIKADNLPDYRMRYQENTDQVIFYTKNAKKLALSFAKTGIIKGIK